MWNIKPNVCVQNVVYEIFFILTLLYDDFVYRVQYLYVFANFQGLVDKVRVQSAVISDVKFKTHLNTYYSLTAPLHCLLNLELSTCGGSRHGIVNQNNYFG
jgi:hypothetical protein